MSTINQTKVVSDNFAIFSIFYSIALWLEMSERWDTPWATVITLALLLFISLTKINRVKFSLFLILNTAYSLYFHFPEVANHVNLIIFANLAILVTIAYGYLRQNQFNQSHDLYRAIASPLRVSLIAVYFWAGFHKLNSAFLDPQFSCSNSMFLGVLEVLKSTILGIPAALVLGAITITFISKVIPVRAINLAQQNSKWLLIILALCLAAAGIAIGALFYFELTGSLFSAFVLATSIMVLLWELMGALMMFIPRLQVIIFIWSMLMHLVLAPIGFVDFGSLAFAFWLTFIPPNYVECLQQMLTIPGLQWQIDRSLIYLLINIIVGLISGLYYLAYPEFNINESAGVLFMIAVLIVIYPVVKKLVDEPNSWRGVKIIDRKMPKFMYLFIFFLSVYAATSYLGLRTAGNFSMFSNLRTEGETSNHLLLGNNQLKIWNYQEDVIKILEIDDESAKIGHKYRPLQDHFLPAVEFKKLVHKWTKAGYTVPLTYEYGDRIYRTDNVVNDPLWLTPKLNWEMRLMDFRVIQPDNGEPNYCRW
ncbi:MAG: hypothetical protein AAF652_03775 [Cyanobacteria bacterium P01_C01_bin.72]